MMAFPSGKSQITSKTSRRFQDIPVSTAIPTVAHSKGCKTHHTLQCHWIGYPLVNVYIHFAMDRSPMLSNWENDNYFDWAIFPFRKLLVHQRVNPIKSH